LYYRNYEPVKIELKVTIVFSIHDSSSLTGRQNFYMTGHTLYITYKSF